MTHNQNLDQVLAKTNQAEDNDYNSIITETTALTPFTVITSWPFLSNKVQVMHHHYNRSNTKLKC